MAADPAASTPSRLSLIVGDQGFRADGGGVQNVDPAILRRAIERVDGVEMRTVERGHPLFGPACDLIRAEALIRIDCEPPLPSGLLALGQRAELSLDARHGSELLMFLGRSLAAMIRKWLTIPQADRPSRAARLPRAGPPICSTTAAARRTRCAPMPRPRIGLIDFLGRYRGESDRPARADEHRRRRPARVSRRPPRRRPGRRLRPRASCRGFARS